ncbi:hypothetical protein CA13_56170 [Planctomycetes bacterium CA13]|uniref:Serine protease n=1 Tax=Novipirellula herctigrandis TaxID=2527986 RepID=A0A5C5ZB97_9BACT|nr:hypothetical protein CA13_56170 [Planctomycetes bacterium CA13]
MPGPNNRPRRDRYTQYPGSYGSGNPDPGYNDHPFLTPKGYRLFRESPLTETASLPTYPAADGGYVQPSEVHGNVVDGPTFSSPNSFSSPNHRDIPPAVNYKQSHGAIVNVLPSKNFPDVDTLGRIPLTPYFDTQLVVDSDNSQLRAIGKLFIYTQRSSWGDPAMGSAWIAGPSLLVTSAHNLFDTTDRTWSRSLEFYPGYDYYSVTERPKCRITSCHIPRGYFENPTTNNDVAFCYVDRNIGDIVNAEIPLETLTDNHFFNTTAVAIVGYPATSGFDFGKQLWRSRGEYLFSRSSGGDDDYSPVIATNFGGGASGCPWIAKDKKTDRYVAVGVTSGHAKLRYDPGEPNLMATVSPFFGPKMFAKLSDDHVFHQFRAGRNS